MKVYHRFKVKILANVTERYTKKVLVPEEEFECETTIFGGISQHDFLHMSEDSKHLFELNATYAAKQQFFDRLKNDTPLFHRLYERDWYIDGVLLETSINKQ